MTDARTFARVPRTYVLQITAIQTVLGTPTLRSTAGRLQVDALCVEAHDAGSDGHSRASTVLTDAISFPDVNFTTIPMFFYNTLTCSLQTHNGRKFTNSAM